MTWPNSLLECGCLIGVKRVPLYLCATGRRLQEQLQDRAREYLGHPSAPNLNRLLKAGRELDSHLDGEGARHD